MVSDEYEKNIQIVDEYSTSLHILLLQTSVLWTKKLTSNLATSTLISFDIAPKSSSPFSTRRTHWKGKQTIKHVSQLNRPILLFFSFKAGLNS